jgi:hypothetical protein
MISNPSIEYSFNVLRIALCGLNRCILAKKYRSCQGVPGTTLSAGISKESRPASQDFFSFIFHSRIATNVPHTSITLGISQPATVQLLSVRSSKFTALSDFVQNVRQLYAWPYGGVPTIPGYRPPMPAGAQRDSPVNVA